MSAAQRVESLPFWLTKLFWIRINRSIAWAIILSPPIQIYLKVKFWPGLYFDLGLLFLHGWLSLGLFGVPKNKAGTARPSMYLLGLIDATMSTRNQFLMSGYRITLGSAFTVLLLGATALIRSALPLWILLLPLTAIAAVQHISGATRYTLQRIGVRGSARDWAVVITLLYLSVSSINMLRALIAD